MIEKWQPIRGFKGLYEVSNLGQIRSLDRLLPRGGAVGAGRYREHFRRYPGRIIKPTVQKSGHGRVCLVRDRKKYYEFVHRAVLIAFVGPPPDGMQCCHNDGNPLNNRLDNLRWDTVSANAIDSVNHGVHTKASKTHCPKGHPYAGENLIRRRTGYRRCRTCDEARQLWWNEQRRKGVSA